MKYSQSFGIVVGVLIVLGVVLFSWAISAVNQAAPQIPANGNTSTWYYISSDLKCLPAPGLYSGEDLCQKAMGTSCYPEDPTCGGNNRTATLYYITAQDQCVVAPHNPYSITLSGGQTAAVLGQESNCQSDVGEPCYADSTCGGAGNPGMITIQGASYKLVTANELEQNAADPGFANGQGSTSTLSLVAVQGTITHVFQSKDKTGYYLVINTGDGAVVFSVGTIDPNTQGPNGVDMSAYSVGVKVSAGGVFIGKLLSLQEALVYAPQLGDIGLPANTQTIVNAAGGVEVMN
jgi:hypothetical protein